MTVLKIDFDGGEHFDKLKVLGNPVILNRFLMDVMDGVRQEWIRFAQQGLNSTRQTYIAGIQEVKDLGTTGHVSIDLVGDFANMIENGAEGYQLQDTMLDGQSRVIAFKHSGPKSSGASGTPMGSQLGPKEGSKSRNRIFTDMKSAMKLGRKIQRAARSAAKQGSALNQSQVKALGAPPTAQRIFGGMRQEAPRQPFSTFRTMTANRDAWQHPGIEARNFIEKVQEYADLAIPAAFELMVNEVLGK